MDCLFTELKQVTYLAKLFNIYIFLISFIFFEFFVRIYIFCTKQFLITIDVTT